MTRDTVHEDYRKEVDAELNLGGPFDDVKFNPDPMPAHVLGRYEEAAELHLEGCRKLYEAACLKGSMADIRVTNHKAINAFMSYLAVIKARVEAEIAEENALYES